MVWGWGSNEILYSSLIRKKAWFKTIVNESKREISLGRSYLGWSSIGWGSIGIGQAGLRAMGWGFIASHSMGLRLGVGGGGGSGGYPAKLYTHLLRFVKKDTPTILIEDTKSTLLSGNFPQKPIIFSIKYVDVRKLC